MTLLSKPIVRLPPFGAGDWLNSPPLVREQLHGRVLLIDFWDYSCLYCLQTLPYLKAWYTRYAPHGLLIIGVHTPEFRFGAEIGQVSTAVDELNLRYPILLDNEQENWDQFANKAWPTKYLIDHKGYIRYMKRGTGGYQETELAIQQLLLAVQPTLDLPTPLPPLRATDQPGAACYPVTPELHAGYQAGLFGGALGNEDGYYPHQPTVYALPKREARQTGHFYLDGIWQASPEAVSFVGQAAGRVVVPYEGAGVNAVLSPTADDVALRLGLWQERAGGAGVIEVQLDGRPLAPHEYGADVVGDEHGRAILHISRPRLYNLVKQPTFRARELTLICHTSGVALYSFTFETCVMEIM